MVPVDRVEADCQGALLAQAHLSNGAKLQGPGAKVKIV
jgi:hypothetical protein